MAHLTKQQQDVIDARGCNLLVSASAGAGKTHTLVERIINLISDEQRPTDVDKLLVVTFTNAAAAEMRQRIGVALIGGLRKENNSKHLKRQVRLINKAHISTMHSFCLGIIRQNFHKLDITPSFRVCDELESELIKNDVAEKLLERNYDRDHNADFLYLVDSFGGQREDTPLQKLIIEIYTFTQSTPWPERWLDDVNKVFYKQNAVSLDEYPWAEYLKEVVMLEIARARSSIFAALEISKELFGRDGYTVTLEQDLILLDELQANCQTGWDRMQKRFSNIIFDRLNRITEKAIDKNAQERIKELRNEYKKIVQKLSDEVFLRTTTEALDDMQQASRVIKELIERVKEFADDYKKAKLEKGLMDFADLEHYALEVLASTDNWPNIKPSEVAEELQDRFEEVLVDEYQDINEVQEIILKLVSRDGEKGKRAPNLLMVGDHKQSIYRFRLAEPYLFQSKQQSFSVNADASNRRISLTKNFRSMENVLEGVNYIFRQIMTPLVGEMEYDQDEELVYGADYTLKRQNDDRKLALLLVDKQGLQGEADGQGDMEDVSGENEEMLENNQVEARIIAEKIKELVKNNFPVYDKQLADYRPIEYRDIVILLRATKGWANAILEEFRHLNIPAYAELSTGYFEAVEVNTIMSLLKIIDNPRQDIPLAAVLRSPIVGLTAEELALIRLQKKTGDFWEAVSKFSMEEDVLAAKINSFVSKLEKWRTKARQGSLSLLLWEIYKKTGYFDYVGGLPGGNQRQANLIALYDRAKQYEGFNFRGVFRFLTFVDAILEKGQDLGEARSMGEKENVVRVMTIHKSKGLEFPVVFVAGLGRKFNLKDLSKNMLFHKKLGLGPDYIDLQKRFVIPTMAKLAIKQKIHREFLAEEMRILYVAMTRAKENLILTGTVRNLVKSLTKWAQIDCRDQRQLPDEVLVSAKTFLDWIGPALIRHRDFGALREIVFYENEVIPDIIYEDKSQWDVKIYDADKIKSSKQEAEVSNNQKLVAKFKKLQRIENEGMYEAAIDKIFSWKYPHLEASKKSSAVSATEVKKYFAEEMTVGGVQKTQELAGAEFGTIMHSVMQHISLDGLRSKLNVEYIKQQIDNLPEKEVLTKQQAEAVDASQVLDFFSSELGKRMLVAEDVRREVTFTLAMPAADIYPGQAEELAGEKVLLKGIIDCMFAEGNELVIIDYKTDQVSGEELERRIISYKDQLNLYALAAEKILKRKVKEKYLCFLKLGRHVEVL